MKVIIKVVSVVLLFSMIFGVSPMVFAEDNVVTTVNTEAEKTLMGLGLVQEADITAENLSKTLTRGEFIELLMKIEKSEYSSNEEYFTDVPLTHINYASIVKALNLSVITRAASKTFNPDDVIELNQAVTMVVRYLGYTIKAENTGGYPTGYLNVANSIKLFHGITVNGQFAKADALKLIFNALNTNMLKSYKIDGSDIKFNEVGTLMEERMDTYVMSGKIDATEYTSLSTPVKMSKGKVSISGRQFFDMSNNAKNSLGYAVKAYYTGETEADADDLVFVYLNDSKNESITIDSKDISGYLNKKYTYFDANGSSKTVDLNATIDIIYNGASISKDILSETQLAGIMKPTNGHVKLIDNNGDGNFDLLISSNYTTVVVDYINPKEYTVYDEINKRTVLILNPNDTRINIVNTYGDSISFEEIKSGQVLLCATSNDGTVIQVLVSDNKLKGSVVETRKVGSETKLIIEEAETTDRKEYNVADGVLSIDSVTGKIENIVMNQMSTFSLDSRGVVSYIQTGDKKDLIYATLIKCALSKVGLTNKLQIKIYGMDGKFSILESGDKILFGDVRQTSEDVYNKLKIDSLLYTPNYIESININYVVPQQLIQYQLDEKGKLQKLVVADYKSYPNFTTEGFHVLIDCRRDSLDTMLMEYSTTPTSATSSLRYASGGAGFSGTFLVDNLTKVIVLPKDKSKEKQYSIKTQKYFTDTYFNVIAYSTKKDSVRAEYVIVDLDKRLRYPIDGENVNGTSTDSNKWGVLTVSKVSDIITDDGEIVKKIEGIKEKSLEVLYYTNPDYNLEINVGDIIGYSNSGELLFDPVIVYDATSDQYYGAKRIATYKLIGADGKKTGETIDVTLNESVKFGETSRNVFGIPLEIIGDDVLVSRVDLASLPTNASLGTRITDEIKYKILRSYSEVIPGTVTKPFVDLTNDRSEKVVKGTISDIVPYSVDPINYTKVFYRMGYGYYDVMSIFKR